MGPVGLRCHIIYGHPITRLLRPKFLRTRELGPQVDVLLANWASDPHICGGPLTMTPKRPLAQG